MGYSMYTVNKLRNIKTIIKKNNIDELQKINLKKIFRSREYNHSLFGKIDMYEFLFYYSLYNDSLECAKLLFYNNNLSIEIIKNDYYNTLKQDKIDYINILSRYQKIYKIKERINY